MPVVDGYAKVIVDESGFRSEMPILLSEQGGCIASPRLFAE